MNQAGGSIVDAAKAGGLVAISLFLILYFMMLQSADRITETVNIFERTLLTVIFIFVPTSEIGAVISVFSGAVATAVSMDDFDPSIIRAVFVFGFIYTSTNIIINWFTVPV
ncbi:hypothetical protein [Halorubrum tebenquichense]|uniref:hypothetical protein n=1 Tax=Halorubrum tebenquichense TaxID=119434 RepID=UPI00126829D8|nr:hypothetical protein [Halorubrum tebenquichense]